MLLLVCIMGKPRHALALAGPCKDVQREFSAKKVVEVEGARFPMAKTRKRETSGNEAQSYDSTIRTNDTGNFFL